MTDIPATPPAASTRRSAESGAGGGWFGSLAVGAALLSALVSFLVLAGMTTIAPTHEVVLGALVTNGVLVLILLGVVIAEGRRILRARRVGAAAAGLHVRIVSLFAGVAAVPAILVAFVAAATLERGLDPWFTGYLRTLLGNSVEIARAYQEGQCQSIARETRLMASDLTRAKVIYDADRTLFRDWVSTRSKFLGFPVVTIMQADQTTIEKVEHRALDGLNPPTEQDFASAVDEEPWCLIPAEGNVYRALVKLTGFNDAYLFVARPVDPRASEFPAAAQAGVAYYDALEAKKLGVQVAFASMYALVTLILLLSAVRLGLAFANRLVQPIRRLIHAADQVSIGNFYVQVPIRRGEGDLGHLAETFNKMTSELRQQHDRLTAANMQIDQRRGFTEALLAGVSAGVIGVDRDGRVKALNPSAEHLLGMAVASALGRPLSELAPELGAMLKASEAQRTRLTQGQITLRRAGRERTITVRIAGEQSSAQEGGGAVVTLDDITDLVAAQRSTAWADVARRIAHEIKNPLTPIQLSAERIRRKYGKVIVEDRAVFDQCTDTIVRQVDDIKRMVDEFSSFARMPKPAMERDDLIECVRQVVFMMRVGHPDVPLKEILPTAPVVTRFDRRLIAQAVTNIVKNAMEAVAAVPEGQRGDGGVTVRLARDTTGMIAIDVIDTGKGFPAEDRQKLLEPYMTTREGGTGLGLAIVGKILEEHGGGIELLDHPDADQGVRGACVRLWFPDHNAVSSSAVDDTAVAAREYSTHER